MALYFGQLGRIAWLVQYALAVYSGSNDLKHATMNVKTWTQFSSKEDLFVEKFNKCGFVILKFDDTASDDVIEQNVKSLQARLGRLEKTFANEIFSLILRKNYIFHANSVIVFMPKYCTQNRFLY